jgi:hypothetical protein
VLLNERLSMSPAHAIDDDYFVAVFVWTKPWRCTMRLASASLDSYVGTAFVFALLSRWPIKVVTFKAS